MADSIEITGLPEFQRTMRSIEHEVLPEATMRAVNRVADSLKSHTAKSVAAQMGVKQAVVRSRIIVKKARRGTEPVAELKLSGNALNMIQFSARQTQKGVSAAPWGKRRVFVSAFIANIRGTELVMTRQKIGGNRVRRMPIRTILGPGIAKSAGDPEVAALRAALIAVRMPIEMESQIKFLVTRMSR